MKVSITFTKQELVDWLDTAQAHAGYWARTAHDLSAVLDGVAVKVMDAENPKKRLGVLTLAMLSPLVVDAEKCPGVFRALGDMDGPRADYLLQAALFGDVKFG